MLLTYKNFLAEVQYISLTGYFYGEVENLEYGTIIFQAADPKELQTVFGWAVEKYLANKLCYPDNKIELYTTAEN